MEKSKNKKFTLSDRINLQAAIEKQLDVDTICKLLDKNRSSIYREITNNSYLTEIKIESCGKCALKKDGERCPLMSFINNKCQNFKPLVCKKLKRFPYVCNKCENRFYCSKQKRYYDCEKAHRLAREKSKASRSHVYTSEDRLKIINSIVTPGVRKGQSLHHIYEANKETLSFVHERTIRRYVYKRLLEVSPADLPRYSRYSRTSYVKRPIRIDANRLFMRTFSDFLKFTDEHPDLHVWQYDSVIGLIDDKDAILTITYPKYRFQFGFLIKKGSARSVNAKIKRLQELLGEDFYKIFQINLSDNGSEFDAFYKLEEVSETRQFRIFYTNPYRSCDKAECERNHEFVRYVFPKKSSTRDLTQLDINLMFSHINSYIRASNKNKTPYQLMMKEFGKKFLDLIGIKEIMPNDVNLKPELISKN